MSMTHTHDAGLDLGERRILHAGALRWLRTLGWALVLFMLFGLAYVAAGLFSAPAFKAGHDLLGLLETVVFSLVAFGLYALLVKAGEGRWPSEIAVRHAGGELLIGVVIGTAVMAAVVGLLVAFGLYDVKGPYAASPTAMLGIGVISGMMEELLMRAILMRLLMRAFGAWPALVLQAALFGAMHLLNPNASAVAAVAIALEAGLLLAAFYLFTGRIWVSIGLHAAWNFTQGWLWGARVSGEPLGPSLFVSTPRPGASALLSGGAFGPEASLPAVAVGAGVATVVLLLAWRKGNFRGRPDAPRLADAAVAVNA